MRNSFLRPLALNYIDPFEKRCPIEEVPNKFLDEPDDYQERVRHHLMEDSEESISIKNTVEERPLQPDIFPRDVPRRTVYTMQEIAEPIVTKKDFGNEEDNEEDRDDKGTLPTFGCWSLQPQEYQFCSKCYGSLCEHCKVDTLHVRRCTKCLQKLCKDCKNFNSISFPNYKIRNNPIRIKNFDTLHFIGCTCSECAVASQLSL